MKGDTRTWTRPGGARTRKLRMPSPPPARAPGRGCVTLPATVYKTLVLPQMLKPRATSYESDSPSVSVAAE